MVDEYQDTNRPQYLLIRRLAETHRNLCVVGDPDQSIYKWRGADLRNILDFEQDFPEAVTVKLERNYRSTQIILDAASAVISLNRNRKDKHLWTDRKGGARISYFRGGDELEEADFITRTARGGLADDVDAKVAVLYRTNAQSRTIEDALMREGLAYKVVGGVRFYERKEIKDALAYMRLVINPHDDVSLRRVINVPARGIGKGVMDAVEHFTPGADDDSAADFPLLAAGLQPALAANSLWARLVRGLEQRAFGGRAAAALTVFRDLIVTLTDIARQDSVSIALGKMLDQLRRLDIRTRLQCSQRLRCCLVRDDQIVVAQLRRPGHDLRTDAADQLAHFDLGAFRLERHSHVHLGPVRRNRAHARVVALFTAGGPQMRHQSRQQKIKQSFN
jgi:DNA helicase-2/ATP-dependent DNA helicase PcrA